MEPVPPIAWTGDGKTPADKIRNCVNGDNVREQFRINSRKQPGTENKKSEYRATMARLLIYFSSYDDSFSVFFYACASQSYDASSFYHKAYQKFFYLLKISLSICFGTII
jgi:hypothetical protein